MLRHLLIMKFKPSTTSADLIVLRRAFQALPRQIAGCLSVEWGDNVSPEQLNKGFSSAVLMNFVDAAARDVYLPHPDHEALKTVLVPLLDDIVVLDYEVLD